MRRPIRNQDPPPETGSRMGPPGKQKSDRRPNTQVGPPPRQAQVRPGTPRREESGRRPIVHVDPPQQLEVRPSTPRREEPGRRPPAHFGQPKRVEIRPGPPVREAGARRPPSHLGPPRQDETRHEAPRKEEALSKSTANLDAIAEEIRVYLTSKDKAREKTLSLGREVIRFCSIAIRAVHRGEYDIATRHLQSARSLLRQIKRDLRIHPDLLESGIVNDAQKEFAEGSATLALVTDQPLPTPQFLEVTYASYLNGLGEAVGEMRRHLLDSLRKGDLARNEKLLSEMDDIYGVLVTMDFPDAMTGGLRRTTDMVRGVLEKTRGDFTLALRQRELEERLQALASRQRSDTRRPLPPRPSRRPPLPAD